MPIGEVSKTAFLKIVINWVFIFLYKQQFEQVVPLSQTFHCYRLFHNYSWNYKLNLKLKVNIKTKHIILAKYSRFSKIEIILKLISMFRLNYRQSSLGNEYRKMTKVLVQALRSPAKFYYAKATNRLVCSLHLSQLLNGENSGFY